MNRDYTINGFPSKLIKHDLTGNVAMSAENGCNHLSKPTLVIGNGTTTLLPAPTDGTHYVIKGMSIIGSGDSGSAKISDSSGTTMYLPCYFSRRNSQTPSNALNITLPMNTGMCLVCADRGATDETFVGISYLKYNDEED